MLHFEKWRFSALQILFGNFKQSTHGESMNNIVSSFIQSNHNDESYHFVIMSHDHLNMLSCMPWRPSGLTIHDEDGMVEHAVFVVKNKTTAQFVDQAFRKRTT